MAVGESRHRWNVGGGLSEHFGDGGAIARSVSKVVGDITSPIAGRAKSRIQVAEKEAKAQESAAAKEAKAVAKAQASASAKEAKASEKKKAADAERRSKAAVKAAATRKANAAPKPGRMSGSKGIDTRPSGLPTIKPVVLNRQQHFESAVGNSKDVPSKPRKSSTTDVIHSSGIDPSTAYND